MQKVLCVFYVEFRTHILRLVNTIDKRENVEKMTRLLSVKQTVPYCP